MQPGEDITSKLFEDARIDAIQKVFGEQLYRHPRVLDINDTGLEQLVPITGRGVFRHVRDSFREMFRSSYSRGLHAVVSFGGFDPEALGYAREYLEDNGLFCHLEEVEPVDLVRFYQDPQPMFKYTPDEFNEWLGSMGFSVISQGTKQATKTFVKWDAPITLSTVDVPMYDLGDSAMVVSSVHYTISRIA